MDYSQLSKIALLESLRLWTEERGCAKLDHDWKAVEDCQEKIDAIHKELDYRDDLDGATKRY